QPKSIQEFLLHATLSSATISSSEMSGWLSVIASGDERWLSVIASYSSPPNGSAFSLEKSLVSSVGALEFAKRFFVRGVTKDFFPCLCHMLRSIVPSLVPVMRAIMSKNLPCRIVYGSGTGVYSTYGRLLGDTGIGRNSVISKFFEAFGQEYDWVRGHGLSEMDEVHSLLLVLVLHYRGGKKTPIEALLSLWKDKATGD
ncbi:hypothetical protein HAX54_044142, partial [Datura stramonium]|nr:hypothetical protein [Datura stramonium]